MDESQARAKGLRSDLRRAEHQNFGPEAKGYPATEVPAELMAEAGRAYFASPNYMKTVAPKTAAAIRAAVKSNPVLAPILQFNTLAGGAVSAAALAEAIRNFRREERDGL